MPFIFKDLVVYQKAMQFTVEVYALNGSLKDRNIKDQLRRAAMSIPLNIAEGQGRMHDKEKRQFYNMARASLLECVPLIEMCSYLGFITQAKYDALHRNADEIGKMLTGLINSVRVTGE